MSEYYKDNEHIVAWQIDNEFSGACYYQCDLDAFRIWLRNKYGSIDKMNEEWGTIFSSHTYRNWEEIILPRYSASDGFSQSGGSSKLLSTPFRHADRLSAFFSDATVEYQRLQIDEIRAFSTLPITHNFMGHFSELNYIDLGRDLDFISWDNYPNHMWAKSAPITVAMAHDLIRGIIFG